MQSTLSGFSPSLRRVGVALGAWVLTSSGPCRAATLTPADVGAHGDGIANDTAALQRLFDRARDTGAEVRLPRGTYAISEYVVIRNGVHRVVGDGGVIRCIGDRQNAGLLLAGPSLGNYANVEDCRIEGLVIDAGNRAAPVNAIYAVNTQRCTIVGNRIFGMQRGTAIHVHGFAAGRSPSTGIVIEDNDIEGEIGVHGTEWWGIRIAAELSFPDKSAAQNDYWKRNFRAADAALPTTGCRVKGNKVTGGYYGVWLTGARNCTVESNVLRNNVRNITLQDNSRGNTVTRNQCRESQSSGIHLAYGASDNLLSANSIVTTRAVGEALLQAYVGVERNRFERNEVISGGSPKYLAYCAVHAVENRFEGNTLRGKAARAFVGMESAWDPTFNDPAHYARNTGPITAAFAREGSVGNAFIGNSIDGENDAPALYLAQVGDSRTPLRDTQLVDNHVNESVHRYCLELVEQQRSALSGIQATGNTFPTTVRREKFVLARGLEHFAQARNNGALDGALGTKP